MLYFCIQLAHVSSDCPEKALSVSKMFSKPEVVLWNVMSYTFVVGLRQKNDTPEFSQSIACTTVYVT